MSTAENTMEESTAQKVYDDKVQMILNFVGVDHRTSEVATARAIREEERSLVQGFSAWWSDQFPGQAGPGEGLSPLALASWAEARTNEDQASPLLPWIRRLRRWEERSQWLRHGTAFETLKALDPQTDCDQLTHSVTSAFRFEAKVLEFITISRIAVSTPVLAFFRNSREAEDNAARRYYDTYSLFANFADWGPDSLRGREAIARMNQIHGRYAIPNDGMKFVLLETAFTWLDGAERIGHRPVLENERRGFFHTHVALGKAMNISGLTDDYHEMYAWYRDFCQASAEFHPSKQETYQMLLERSLIRAFPELGDAFALACAVAMDPTYRSAVGVPEPTVDEVARVRAVFFTVGSFIETLPPVPWIRSMQSNPVHRAGTLPSALGADDRSPHFPKIAPDASNGGFPEQQRPYVTAEQAARPELPTYSWEEIRRHTTKESLWTVIRGEVYDFTTFALAHPGGAAVLKSVAGQDGTAAFDRVGHGEVVEVFKLNYRIGRLEGP